MSEEGQVFDLAVIGAGPAGYVAALRAAELGLKTVVFEKDALGGTCLNRGCIPTKTLLRGAHVLSEAQLWGRLGVVGAPPAFDWAAMLARKDEVVAQLQGGIAAQLRAKGVTVVASEARVAGEGVVLAGGARYAAKDILVAAGSAPLRPPIPGLDLDGVWTSDDVLAGRFARDIVVIGGGVIGMEFATLLGALGVKVTVLEALDRVLATADREISQNLAMILKKRGVSVHVGARVSGVERAADGKLVVRYAERDVAAEVASEAVLVAIGRRGQAEGVLADGCAAAVERGQFVVDAAHRTSVPHVWAVGDVARGDVQLAHAASAYAVAVVEQIAGVPPSVDTGLIPSCVFTDPEIASVGLTEAEAKAQGKSVRAVKFLMSANGKTVVEIAERSFIKLVAEADGGRLVGAQLMCPHAADLVGELALAVARGLTAADVARVVHAHPTFGEGVCDAAHLFARPVRGGRA